GPIKGIESLGNNAIEIAARASQPLAGLGDGGRGRRQSKGRRRALIVSCERFEKGAAFFKASLYQRLAFVIRQEIECDENCRRFLGQFADAALGWMKALKQLIEIELAPI